MKSLIHFMNATAFIDRFHDIAAAPRFSLHSCFHYRNETFWIIENGRIEAKLQAISWMPIHSLIDFMIPPRRHNFQCIHELDWRMQMQSLIDFMNGNIFIDRFHDVGAMPRFSEYSLNRLKNVNAIIFSFHECQYIHWLISWHRRGATIFSVFMMK